YLLFGYAGVTSIHVWHNLVDWLITGFLECLITKITGVLALLFIIQHSVPSVNQVVNSWKTFDYANCSLIEKSKK
ncbi:MAG: hypothetical protein ACFFD4_40105, partial [Candidatus Odinarchaeota archaeon]